MRFLEAVARLRLDEEMPLLRHCKNISAMLFATLCAATCSISFSNPVIAAENKKSIALADVAHTATVKRAALPTKLPGAQAIYPRTHFEKAYYFKQKHDLNNALIEFLKSTQENPLQVRGFYEQALIFRERGYLKLASSSLEQALAVKPDYQDARILLATISIQQGNVGGAVRELTRSLGLEVPAIKTDSQQETAKGSKQHTTLQKVSKAMSEKVKDADALFDAMPSVILQSIHPAIKNEKLTESVAVKESAKPEDDKTTVTDSASQTASVETTNKHFDLASIKDSFESAMRASFSLSTYWNRMPFGSSESSEKTSEQIKDKVVETPVEKKAGKHKKEKKQKHKRKKDETAKVDVVQSSDQTVVEDQTEAKSDTTDTTAMLPDFVKKAIAEHKEAEEMAVMATQPTPEQKIIDSPESNKTLFSSANFSQSTHAIIKGLKTADTTKDEPRASLTEATEKTTVKLDSDEWAVKLRNLVEHGTNSLKDGEAFMFAEDTGEASLFLADGSVIRRVVQLPRDQTEIVRERRPDMLIPDDLLYKLSLLGKLIPHPESANTEAAPLDQAVAQSTPQTSPAALGKDFKVDNVMGESQNFWGWLKTAFKF